MKKYATMLPDIAGSLFKRPATEAYPFVRSQAPMRLRGLLKWTPGPCTGCGLCAMDCPADALRVTMLDRKAKKFFLTYNVDRCLFCGQCVVSCRLGALAMSSQEWELAALTREAFTIRFGKELDDQSGLAGGPQGEPHTDRS